jgi:GLPGLI family protein
MKKIVRIYCFSVITIIVLAANLAFGQKKVSEMSVVYDYVITSNSAAPKASPALEGATNTIYIKGNLSRSEMANSLYSSTTIFDANNNTGVILKEVSGQKLLIRLSAENWKQINKPFEAINFASTTETKTIAGYKCTKAIAKTSDGYTYTVFYTNEIIPENKNYNAKFKNLDGLPLEYELNNGTISIKYTVSKINLNPVPASKFDIPKSGYREMTYDESKKLNTGG